MLTNIRFNWQSHLSKVIFTFLKTSCFIQWRLRELLTPITNAVKKRPSPTAISDCNNSPFQQFQSHQHRGTIHLKLVLCPGFQACPLAQVWIIRTHG